MSEIKPLRQPRMSLKLFGGFDRYKLEGEINEWLDSAYDDCDDHDLLLTVVRSNFAMCSVGDSGDMHQFLVVELWYRCDDSPKETPPCA